MKLMRLTTIPGSLRGLLKGQLKFMSQHFDVIGVSSPGDILKEVGEREGIKTIGIPMTRTISPLYDVIAIWKLYKLFRKEKPEIVHTHTPKAGTLGMIAAKLAGVPHRLHTVAGLPLLVVAGKKRKVLDAVEKVTYSCATMVYPNSFGLQEIIKNNKYTSDEKLKVIGRGSSNGIDTSFFDPSLYSIEDRSKLRKQLEINQDDFVFIFVGRMVRDKGINELIQAFQTLHSKFDKVKLVLLGNYERHLDPLDPITEAIIDRNSSILRLGYKDDVRPYFAIANMLTFPSYREGFPNVVLQAAAMDLPCIVTDINGCNEIIKHNVNGFIIPVKSTDLLFKYMEHAVNHREELEEMSVKSRPYIIENYERSFVWDEILKEYRSLLN